MAFVANMAVAGVMFAASLGEGVAVVAEWVSGKSPKAANCVAAEALGVADGRAVVKPLVWWVDDAGVPATAAFKACIKGLVSVADAAPDALCKRGEPLADKATLLAEVRAAFAAYPAVPTRAEAVGAPSPNSFCMAASSKPIDWANAVKLSALGVALGAVMMCICGLSAIARKDSAASEAVAAASCDGVADGMAIMAT